MRIIIRADGGAKIGMGHIMRTTVLAQHLKHFAEVVYLCKTGSEYASGINYLEKQGYKAIAIDEGNHIGRLSSLKGDILITDSYDVDEKYFAATKKIFPITGYIDDLNRYIFHVDFLINQNAGAEDLTYPVNTKTKLFLGSKYALLREEFSNLPKRKIKKDIQDIMITMGGADPRSLSSKIVEELYNELTNVVLHVVIGPSFSNIEEINKLESHNVKLYYNPQMAKLMLNCDLAISACGSTLYELAACGTPTIGMITAENQKKAAKKMSDVGFIELVYKHNALKSLIRGLDFTKRRKMSESGQKLVDGLGGKRIGEKVYKYYVGPK